VFTKTVFAGQLCTFRIASDRSATPTNSTSSSPAYLASSDWRPPAWSKTTMRSRLMPSATCALALRKPSSRQTHSSRIHRPGALTCSIGDDIGNANPKLLPTPTWLSTHSRPWWSLTNCWLTLSPRPLPRGLATSASSLEQMARRSRPDRRQRFLARYLSLVQSPVAHRRSPQSRCCPLR